MTVRRHSEAGLRRRPRHRRLKQRWEPVWVGEEAVVYVVAGRLQESGVATRVTRLAAEPRSALAINESRSAILVPATQADDVRALLRERGETGVVDEPGDHVVENARSLLRALPLLLLVAAAIILVYVVRG